MRKPEGKTTILRRQKDMLGRVVEMKLRQEEQLLDGEIRPGRGGEHHRTKGPGRSKGKVRKFHCRDTPEVGKPSEKRERRTRSRVNIRKRGGTHLTVIVREGERTRKKRRHSLKKKSTKPTVHSLDKELMFRRKKEEKAGCVSDTGKKGRLDNRRTHLNRLSHRATGRQEEKCYRAKGKR